MRDRMQMFLDLIDFRSFSSLWFWIMLAVLWTGATQRVLGIPYDLVVRARRSDGAAAADLQDLVRIHVTRQVRLWRGAGLVLAGAGAFAATALLVLGIWYAVELAQAVLLLVGPLGAAAAMSTATALRIEALRPEPEALYGMLAGLRLRVQALGIVTIFVTAAWGMWTNLAVLRGF